MEGIDVQTESDANESNTRDNQIVSAGFEGSPNHVMKLFHLTDQITRFEPKSQPLRAGKARLEKAKSRLPAGQPQAEWVCFLGERGEIRRFERASKRSSEINNRMRMGVFDLCGKNS